MSDKLTGAVLKKIDENYAIGPNRPKALSQIDGYSRDEVDAQVRDLIDKGLVEAEREIYVAGDSRPQHLYVKLTERGKRELQSCRDSLQT